MRPDRLRVQIGVPQEPGPTRFYPMIGCLSVWLVLTFLFLVPLFLAEAMHLALTRLHLTPGVAILVLIGLFAGSLINIPVHRIQREIEQPELVTDVFGFRLLFPQLRRVRTETVISVNVGGCVIPAGLACWEVLQMARADEPVLVPTFLIALVNIVVCYRIAVPVQGVGIVMPGIVSPLVAVGLTWLLLPGASAWRAPVAFVAGVSGPLIGADLLNLRRLSTVSTGLLSIGGAGTFDGIVLSGLLAAFLA